MTERVTMQLWEPVQAHKAFMHLYNTSKHPSYALVGSADHRCPQDCRHKAPQYVALMFADVYRSQGNKAAAAMAVAHRESA